MGWGGVNYELRITNWRDAWCSWVMQESRPERNREGSGVGAAGRVGGEPVDDEPHVTFESAGRGDVEDPGADIAAAFEVVGGAAGGEDEGAFGAVDPCAVDEEAHGAVEDVEEVVFVVRVRAGAFGPRFDPPFGDGVPVGGLGAVGLEDGGDGAHVVRAAFAGAEDDGLAGGVWHGG